MVNNSEQKRQKKLLNRSDQTRHQGCFLKSSFEFTLPWRRPLAFKCVRVKNISVIDFDNRPDCRLFKSPSALSLSLCFDEEALWSTQITANTRNAFPPGGFWRLSEKMPFRYEAMYCFRLSTGITST